MNDLTICVDMDGVVADFVGAALPLFNEYDTIEFWSQNKGKYDIAGILGLSQKEFWDRIEIQPYFWEDILVYPEAGELVNICERYVGKDNIYFLSSPCMSDKCFSGKFNWIETHFPEYKNRLILCNDKHHFASPNKILIDDSESKVNNFRHHGGKAYLWPKPWNFLHAKYGKNNLGELDLYLQIQVENFEADKRYAKEKK